MLRALFFLSIIASTACSPSNTHKTEAQATVNATQKIGATTEALESKINIPAEEVENTDIVTARNLMIDMIEIRSSSPLFALTSEEQIEKRVKFYHTTSQLEAGVIVMSIDDGFHDSELESLDPILSEIIVVFNRTDGLQKIKLQNAGKLRLSPIQVHGSDPMVRKSQIALNTVSVPGHTTAVFVRPE